MVRCWLQHAGKVGYMAIGLGAAVPCVILPWLLEHKADRRKPWSQKFWVKANVWIAIFSFIGNYFWTHYFYTVLGAKYTFPSWRLNNVSDSKVVDMPTVACNTRLHLSCCRCPSRFTS